MPVMSLRCHLLGDKRNTFFTVKISKDDDVSILKKMIKKDKSVKLANFDASDLILYNVSLPIADFDTQFDTLQLESHPILSDANKLSSIFPNTSDDLIHIIVNLPPGTSISIPSPATPEEQMQRIVRLRCAVPFTQLMRRISPSVRTYIPLSWI